MFIVESSEEVVEKPKPGRKTSGKSRSKYDDSDVEVIDRSKPAPKRSGKATSKDGGYESGSESEDHPAKSTQAKRKKPVSSDDDQPVPKKTKPQSKGQAKGRPIEVDDDSEEEVPLAAPPKKSVKGKEKASPPAVESEDEQPRRKKGKGRAPADDSNDESPPTKSTANAKSTDGRKNSKLQVPDREGDDDAEPVMEELSWKEKIRRFMDVRNSRDSPASAIGIDYFDRSQRPLYSRLKKYSIEAIESPPYGHPVRLGWMAAGSDSRRKALCLRVVEVFRQQGRTITPKVALHFCIWLCDAARRSDTRIANIEKKEKNIPVFRGRPCVTGKHSIFNPVNIEKARIKIENAQARVNSGPLMASAAASTSGTNDAEKTPQLPKRSLTSGVASSSGTLSSRTAEEDNDDDGSEESSKKSTPCPVRATKSKTVEDNPPASTKNASGKKAVRKPESAVDPERESSSESEEEVPPPKKTSAKKSGKKAVQPPSELESSCEEEARPPKKTSPNKAAQPESEVEPSSDEEARPPKKTPPKKTPAKKALPPSSEAEPCSEDEARPAPKKTSPKTSGKEAVQPEPEVESSSDEEVPPPKKTSAKTSGKKAIDSKHPIEVPSSESDSEDLSSEKTLRKPARNQAQGKKPVEEHDEEEHSEEEPAGLNDGLEMARSIVDQIEVCFLTNCLKCMIILLTSGCAGLQPRHGRT